MRAKGDFNVGTWHIFALLGLAILVSNCASGATKSPPLAQEEPKKPTAAQRVPERPLPPTKEPEEPLLTQGERIFQLSYLTAASMGDDVSISFKVEASAGSKETVSIVMFGPSYQNTAALDILEVKAKEIESPVFSIMYTERGNVVSSTYWVRQGVFLCFDVSPEQLEAGDIKFRIKNTAWERLRQIGLAQKKRVKGNYDAYTLVSNALTKAN